MKRHLTLFVLFLLIGFLACSSKNGTGTSQTGLPDFTLTSLDGESYTLASLRGKVVLIDFWATWCPPCRNSIPHLISLYEKYKDRGFIVLGISLEDKMTLESFRSTANITYPILLGTNEVAKAYDVTSIPKSIFVDKSGKTRKVQVGFSPELAPVFEALVDTLVSE